MWHRVNLALLCAAIGAGGCDLLTGPNDAADPFDAEADSAPSTNDASIEPLDGALGELLDADINTGAPKRPEAPPIDAGADAAAVIDAAAIADAEAIIDAEPPVDPFAGECEVGTRRCVDLVTTQTCARDPNGRPRWDAVFGCGFDQVCALDEIEGTALCVSRADLCDEGDMRCAPDGRQVLRCERRPPFHRTRWTLALDCEAEGMGHCVPFGEDEPPAWATSPDALCQNAC
ncbi:MAG: hypothetical protein KC620_14325, partial [Myxococcales bacterium]|nr:hypothetical protein [Myxococcales bacterium]